MVFIDLRARSLLFPDVCSRAGFMRPQPPASTRQFAAVKWQRWGSVSSSLRPWYSSWHFQTCVVYSIWAVWAHLDTAVMLTADKTTTTRPFRGSGLHDSDFIHTSFIMRSLSSTCGMGSSEREKKESCLWLVSHRRRKGKHRGDWHQNRSEDCDYSITGDRLWWSQCRDNNLMNSVSAKHL